jgi:hypothetical protein
MTHINYTHHSKTLVYMFCNRTCVFMCSHCETVPVCAQRALRYHDPLDFAAAAGGHGTGEDGRQQ